MKTPDIPANEEARLGALQALDLLDTPREARFDRYTRLARAVCDVPISVVSLIDRDRQWFKSCVGLDIAGTSRDVSFCGHAILERGVFYIADALEDIRFAQNPLVVGPPYIRFYAGVPLHTPDGFPIGTLCVIDRRPRMLGIDELRHLRDLADCLQREIAMQALGVELGRVLSSPAFAALRSNG